MPRAKISKGEYYHIFNRGVEKRLIFIDDKDRWRFMTLLIVLQGDAFINQIGRIVPDVESRTFDNVVFKNILESQYVELISFCLMPNHFHLILKELQESGISKYMQRFLTAYTKYFNIRHSRSGHLFGSKFQSRHIDSNAYLNYLSAYIHLNSRELKNWYRKEIKYPWSSFQDYTLANRWNSFLNSAVILEQFGNKREYRTFVEETPIKEILKNVES